MRELGLVTVCEEAACPNIGECWTKKHATVMILGDTCTRACAFCNVKTGMPRRGRSARARACRDRRGRARASSISWSPRSTATICPTAAPSQFVKVIEALRKRTPATTIEILTPDFRNKSESAVEAIVAAGPDVYNHNLETVPRLYPTIRPGRALLCLAAAARERQAQGAAHLHQVGADGRARRAAARGPPGDGRHALGRRRFPDHGPISPADPAPRRRSRSSSRPRRSTPMRRSPGPRASCWSRRRR